jgi:predicted permease
MSVPTTFATFEPFRGWLPSRVVARVAPGLTPPTASAQLLARWDQRLATSGGDMRRYLDEIVQDVRANGAAPLLQRELVGEREKPLAILMGATALLLLIACANVANLMLSDSARRRREVALRQVLGATRLRIVRQLLAECVTLSLAGALLGVALAPVALSVLRAMLPADLAGLAPAQLDLRVLFFATMLAVATGVAFGLWPAIGAARDDTSATIKSGGGHGSTVGRGGRARRVLVGAELALTVMLLVAAGLMIRSFDRLMSQEYGMDPRRVATLEMSFPRSSQGPGERLRIVDETLTRLAAQPGFDAVGAVNDLPLRGGGGLGLSINVPGAPAPKNPGEMRFARYLIASGGYFRALGIDLLRGRVFTAADDSLAPPVAIISSAMAREYWPSTDPVGRSFTLPRDSVPITVIGVVADVREGRADGDPGPQMYFSFYAQPPNNLAIVAKSTLSPNAVLLRLREAVRAADPRQPVFNVRMMEDVLGNAVAPRRTNMLLITIFAALALLLAALGVYAVVSYGVAQRTREFGIRSALGATANNLLALVSREMVAVIVTGVAVGLGGAWALSRVLESQMYGVDVHDRMTFATVPLVLLLPACLATLLPAFRATRTNPAEVMRTD